MLKVWLVFLPCPEALRFMVFLLKYYVERRSRDNAFILMNSCSNILRVEYLKFTTSGHGQNGGPPPSVGQDMDHYDHNKPHSRVIQSYLEILDSQQNQ